MPVTRCATTGSSAPNNDAAAARWGSSGAPSAASTAGSRSSVACVAAAAGRTVPSLASTERSPIASITPTGRRSTTVSTTVSGRSLSTLADAIHGSVSSLAVTSSGCRWKTFVDGSTPASPRTSPGRRLTAPSTRMCFASNSGVYVRAHAAVATATGTSKVRASTRRRRTDRSDDSASDTRAADRAHLRLQHDAAGPADAGPDEFDERAHVGRGRAGRGDDEVGVLRRDRRAPDGSSLQPGRVDQGGRVFARRVREHAPAVLLRDGLGVPAPPPRSIYGRADLGRIARPEPERGGDHHRVGRQAGRPVGEPHLFCRKGPGAVLV